MVKDHFYWNLKNIFTKDLIKFEIHILTITKSEKICLRS